MKLISPHLRQIIEFLTLQIDKHVTRVVQSPEEFQKDPRQRSKELTKSPVNNAKIALEFLGKSSISLIGQLVNILL